MGHFTHWSARRPSSILRNLNYEVGKLAKSLYGGLRANQQDSYVEEAREHFMRCDTDQALDFIELIFHTGSYPVAILPLIDVVNDIFQDEGIGYELTKFHVPEPPPEPDGQIRRPFIIHGMPEGTIYPQIIRKDTEYLHAEVVRPCLEALGTPGFDVALKEMLKAHEALRRSDFAGSITDAEDAFESVMKTICQKKGWRYAE